MSAPPRQIALDLVYRPARGREHFLVSPENEAAVRMIDGWRDWPSRRLALTGPPASGKTHLAHVWLAESGGVTVPATDLAAADAPALAAARAVLVEDVDRVAAMADPRRAEEGLFHLHNLLGADGGYLLVTGCDAPRGWRIGLPDLASRLQGLSVARIAPPDDTLLSSILVKLFADRQLQVGPEVVKYLSERIDRSFAAARDAVTNLDRLSLERKRPISRALASVWLRETGSALAEEAEADRGE